MRRLHRISVVLCSLVELSSTPASAAEDSARDLRVAVERLVSRAEAPTTDDLLHAARLADSAVRIAQREPWGYAARCDVARRWADPGMIDRCLADLRAVAPNHAETARAFAVARKAPTGMLIGWAVLLLLCLATGAHAVRAKLFIAVVVLTAAAVATPSAHAGFAIADDSNPEASVPTPRQRDANPLEFGYYLQDVIARAEAATRRGEHDGAIKYYRALAKAVPDRAVAFSKLCEALETVRRNDEALVACRSAVAREGAVANDHLRLSRLILGDARDLAPSQVEELNGIIGHLEGQDDTRVFGHHVQCELALRLDDAELLQRCTGALAAAAPNDSKTISLKWALAFRKGRKDEAGRLIAQAREAGVAPEGIERMERAVATMSAVGPLAKKWLVTLSVLAAAGGALLLARRRRAA